MLANQGMKIEGLSTNYGPVTENDYYCRKIWKSHRKNLE